MDFDKWGNVTLDTAPGFQPFGFAGGLLDLDTGLTRFGARDYSAAEGRWTAKDAAGLRASLNIFAYADNDPVNLIDRTGFAPEDIQEAVDWVEANYDVSFDWMGIRPADFSHRDGTGEANPFLRILYLDNSFYAPSLDCNQKAQLAQTLLHEGRHMQDGGFYALFYDLPMSIWHYPRITPRHQEIYNEGPGAVGRYLDECSPCKKD